MKSFSQMAGYAIVSKLGCLGKKIRVDGGHQQTEHKMQLHDPPPPSARQVAQKQEHQRTRHLQASKQEW